MNWKHRISRMRLLVAVVLSAALALMLSLLVNLASTYLAPQFADRPQIVYVAVLITFILSLPVTAYCVLRADPASRESDTLHAPELLGSDAAGIPLPAKPYLQFIGRDDRLREVMAALRDPVGRLVVGIDGQGGIGKTTLAREAAECCRREHLFDDVLWERSESTESAVRMPGLRSQGLTFERVLDALGRHLGGPDVRLLSVEDKTQRIRTLLMGHRLLIVLDNLETAAEDQDDIVRALVPLLGPSKALLTSRHRFMSELYSIHLAGFGLEDAIRFTRIEANARGIVRVAQAETEELAQLASATGGSPLALRLLTGQLEHHSLKTVLSQLSEWYASDACDDDYRRLYKHIFMPSWRLLSKDAKHLLIAMSHFAADIGGNLEAVSVTSGVPAHALKKAISELWRFSFLEIRQSTSLNDTRYYLHPLTQYFILADIIELT